MIDKIELLKQHYRNVSTGQIDLDREILSSGVLHTSVVAGTLKGVDAYVTFIAGFKQAFPDLTFEILTFLENHDTVVAEGVFKGTNSGRLMTPKGEMPATGKNSVFHSSTSGKSWTEKSLRTGFTMIN